MRLQTRIKVLVENYQRNKKAQEYLQDLRIQEIRRHMDTLKAASDEQYGDLVADLISKGLWNA
jgi:hypothetical protein